MLRYHCVTRGDIRKVSQRKVEQEEVAKKAKLLQDLQADVRRRKAPNQFARAASEKLMYREKLTK